MEGKRPAPLVVVWDGSPVAHRALEHAAGLARGGRTVVVVNVLPFQPLGSRFENVPAEARHAQRRLLEEAGAILARAGVHGELVAAAGDPLQEIASLAARRDAGAVVVGRSRSRRPQRRLADRLVHRGGVDVLVVP